MMTGPTGQFQHPRGLMEKISISRICQLAVLLFLTCSGQAASAAYRPSEVVVQDNLAVFLLHGEGFQSTPTLALHKATELGLAKIRRTESGVVVDNLADTGLFIQGGTLLRGG